MKREKLKLRIGINEHVIFFRYGYLIEATKYSFGPNFMAFILIATYLSLRLLRTERKSFEKLSSTLVCDNIYLRIMALGSGGW